MGLTKMALLGMRLRPSVSTGAVAEAVAAEPRVDYLVLCTGQYDLLAEVACSNADELVTVLKRLAALEGVDDIDVFSYLRLQYLDESVWSAGRVSALDPDASAARLGSSGT
jgi:Lrp/AsnC family transcriptional regulator for asnA, asnC and gidA